MEDTKINLGKSEMKKKFKFFSTVIPSEVDVYHLTVVNLENIVDEIPLFDNEDQAFDWYTGVYLAHVKLVDNYNNNRRRKKFQFKKWYQLPVRVYIFPEYSIKK